MNLEHNQKAFKGEDKREREREIQRYKDIEFMSG